MRVCKEQKSGLSKPVMDEESTDEEDKEYAEAATLNRNSYIYFIHYYIII